MYVLLPYKAKVLMNGIVVVAKVNLSLNKVSSFQISVIDTADGKLLLLR